jgi:DNA topoisomerase-2
VISISLYSFVQNLTFFSVVQITPEAGGKFAVKGRIDRVDDTTLRITELPIQKWTQDYKTFLDEMLVEDSKKRSPPDIKDFKENHTDTTVAFTITAEKANIDEWEKLAKGGLYANFKLAGSLSTSNMHLFDETKRIIKYANPEEILKVFFDMRLEYYIKRKTALVEKL